MFAVTAIDCFSRWVWSVPLVEKDVESITAALLIHVLFDLAMFFLQRSARTTQENLLRKLLQK